jgi:hypothetical protein
MTTKDTQIAPAVPDDDTPDYEAMGLLPGEAEGLAEFEAEEKANAPESALDGLDEVGPDPEAEDETPAEPEPEPEAAKAEEAKPEPEPEPEPEPKIDLTGDLKSAREAIETANAKLAEIQDQWDNGDIGQEEYDAAKREAEAAHMDAMSEFNSLKTLEKAQSLTERQKQQSEQAKLDRQWDDVQKRFIAANPELVKPEHITEFNQHVNIYTNSKGPYAGLPFERQLDMAMKSYADVLEARGKTPPAMTLFSAPGEAAPAEPDAKLPDPPPDPQAKEREARGRQMAEPPVTLRDMPNDAMDPHASVAQKWAARIENETDPDRLDELWAQIPGEIADRVLQYGAG